MKYTLDGLQFSDREFKRVILISEKDSEFSIKYFLRSYFSHFMILTFGPVIGVIAVLISERFNVKVL